MDSSKDVKFLKDASKFKFPDLKYLGIWYPYLYYLKDILNEFWKNSTPDVIWNLLLKNNNCNDDGKEFTFGLMKLISATTNNVFLHNQVINQKDLPLWSTTSDVWS